MQSRCQQYNTRKETPDTRKTPSGAVFQTILSNQAASAAAEVAPLVLGTKLVSVAKLSLLGLRDWGCVPSICISRRCQHTTMH